MDIKNLLIVDTVTGRDPLIYKYQRDRLSYAKSYQFHTRTIQQYNTDNSSRHG